MTSGAGVRLGCMDDADSPRRPDPPRRPAFCVRRVAIPPGDSRPHDDADWEDAIVVVGEGRVQLECRAGGRREFCRGDVLWLTGLDLRVVHNPGEETAVLVGVSRRQPTRPPA